MPENSIWPLVPRVEGHTVLPKVSLLCRNPALHATIDYRRIILMPQMQIQIHTINVRQGLARRLSWLCMCRHMCISDAWWTCFVTSLWPGRWASIAVRLLMKGKNQERARHSL